MSTFSLDLKTLQLAQLFEQLTGAQVKDCFAEGNALTVVVDKSQMSKAIGKQGSAVKRASKVMKKTVSVLAFEEDVIAFVKQLLPFEGIAFSQEDEILVITCKDTKTKGKVYGREKTHLAHVTNMVKKYYPVKDVQVK